MKKGFLLLFFAAMAFAPAFSQQMQHICGNARDQSALLPRLRENKLVMEAMRAAASDRGGGLQYVPIHFHLVGDADGAGKHKEIKVLDQLCKLNAAFLPVGMQFYLSPHPLHGLFDKSINHDAVFLSQTNSLLMNLRRHQNAVNVFVVEEPVPVGSELPPGSIVEAYYSPASDWIVSRKTQTNGTEPNTTVPHEMGHLFSLPHTFYGYEPNPFNNDGDPTWPIAPVIAPNNDATSERKNGTNCATAADEICDTPADFNCGYGWPNNCPLYNLGAKDPLGTLIVPEQNNMMSYFNGCANYHFSQDQIGIMNADLAHATRNYLDNTFVPTATDITSPTDLIIAPANAGTVAYYNSVLLEWQAVPGATHYLIDIDITPTFATLSAQVLVETGTSKLITNLAPSKTYYWRIKPFNALVGCAAPRTRNFKTPITILSTLEIEGLTAWQISPNPVANGESANLNILTEKAFEAVLRITDAAGRTISVQQNVAFPQGESTYQLGTEGLPNGLYFVSLESGNGRNVRKMSVLR
ncbi:MAG: T9SS type A sorting domain-containing protein [Saprospiraceae bacterium]